MMPRHTNPVFVDKDGSTIPVISESASFAFRNANIISESKPSKTLI
jgi:hypothetical protein